MKMKAELRTHLTAAALGTVLCGLSACCHAGWLEDFYDSAGAGSNVTPAQAFASQSTLGYSGGGMVWRVPGRNFYPVQIAPPSMKAGCGGIDLYLGAFSFPNKDQFIQALRNFGQASIGYFFQLALRSMSPEIAVTLEGIQDIANSVNQFGMNSCQAAQAAAGWAVSKLGVDRKGQAEGYATSVGQFVDRFDAALGLQNDGDKVHELSYRQKYGKGKAHVSRDDTKKSMPSEVNVLYWALVKANSPDITDSEIRLLMSLVGPSVIIKRGGGPKDEEDVKHQLTSTISFGQIFDGPDRLPIYECDEEVLCLNPAEKQEAHKSFKKMAEAAAEEMMNLVGTRQDARNLSASTKTIAKLSSVPLYRAAAMAQSGTVGSVMAKGLLPDIVEYAGLDAAVNFASSYLTDALRALETADVPEALKHDVEIMKNRILETRRNMYQTVSSLYDQRGKPFEKLEQLEKVERMMYSNMSASIMANARFGKQR
jgi:conjugative transfer pilus assembly protein TraH